MVFKEQFVVVLKVNGKVLREKDDNVVTLPFGSEYSLLLKNLTSRTAGVNISIDGKDVLGGSQLVIDKNSEHELKGFLEGSEVRNKFKFIQKTKEVQEHRGDKIDDGIIRIEFAYEKRSPKVREIIWDHIPYVHPHDHWYHTHRYYEPIYKPFWTYCSNLASNDSDAAKDNLNVQVYNCSSTVSSEQHANSSSVKTTSESQTRSVAKDSQTINHCFSEPLEDEGITVKGSETTQGFQYASLGILETSEVITIRMRGVKSDESNVVAPVTVKTKLECSSCGKKWSSTNKFCGDCGTFLE